MTAKLSVLLVEDSEDDASMILRELKKGGYAVAHRRVFSRDTMAAALDEKTWDLVLADHNMPGFNSVDALALVRERKLDVPFIIVSGVIGEETAVAAMKAGAHDFVMKGKLARLVPAVGRELREAENRRMRARAEEHAKKESLRAQHYLDIAGTMLLALDARGTVTMINRKGCDILGRPEKEILGKNWFDNFLPPRVREEIRTMFPKYLAEGGPEEWENTVLAADGQERVIAWHNVTVRNGHGKAVGTLSSGEDLTERKRAEATLQKSEEKYHALVDTMTDVIFTLDFEGNVIDIAPSIKKLIGYSSEEITGKEFAGFLHPDDLPKAQNEFLNAIQGKGHPIEIRVNHADGTTRWISINAVLIMRDGEPDNLLCVLTDIHEKKVAEEALQESEERFKRLTGLSFEGIGIIVDGKVADANPCVARMLGYDPGEFSGRPLMEFVAPASREAVMERMRSGSDGPSEHLALRKDGSTFPVEVRGGPIMYKGRPGRVVSLRNVTERRSAEDKIRHLASFPELNPNPVLELDKSGKILFSNAAAGRLLKDTGLSDPKELLPAHFDSVLAELEQRPGRTANYDVPVKDRAFQVSIFRPEGSDRLRIYALDITGRKQAEEALLLKNFVFDVSISANSIANIDGVIIEANNAFLRIWGFSGKEEVVGRPLLDFFYNKEEAVAIITALNSTGAWDGDFTGKRKNGSTFIAHGLATVIKDESGKVIGYQSSVNDITERKNAEEELRESEERFRALFEQAAVGIAQVAPDGRWLNVNQRWCDILGYTREELLTKSFLDITHPDDVDNNVANQRKLLNNEIHTYSTDKRYIGKDMSVVWVNLTVSLQRDAAGAPKYSISVIEDISERKEAEEALRKSEQQFRLLAENARDLVYRVRLKPVPTIEYISPSALSLTGHSPEEFLSDPALAARLLPPEAREAQEMNPKMKGNLGGPVTMPWRRSDGATAWLELVSHPVLNAAGKLVAVEGVGRDTTERKQVEDALRESEEKFRNLAEHSPDMIFINVKGRVVYANHRWEEVMGYTREEFGSPGFDFLSTVISPEHRDAMREKYRKHLSRQDLTPDEHVVIAKDGRRIPVILSTALIRFGGENAILGTLTDITELKRSEEKLARLNQQNELVLSSAAEGILGLDLQGNQTFVNPAAARMLGYEVEELLGRPGHSTWHHAKPDKSPCAKEECGILSTLVDGAVRRSSTEVFWRKDGTCFPVEYTITPIYEKSLLTGAVLTFSDITGRKQAEENMQDSLKEKVVLLKEIHHRVKNNLQIIHSLLNMQSRKMKDTVALGAIRESQNRVRTMALIHERLYMSENLSDINFREYLTQLLHEIYSSFGADPDRIRTELELGDLRLNVDTAIPCGLIVNELISNSLKHGFPGGRKGAIRIGVGTDGDGTVRLEVGDTGAGLPEGLDFRKTETLGLQLVCTLVDQLRGTIKLGGRQGTDFVIEFNPKKAEAG